MLLRQSPIAALLSINRDALRLTDLSLWPRAGLKGTDALTFLQAKRVTIPAINAAGRQDDQALLLRLAEREFVALAGGPDHPTVPARLPSFVTGGDNPPGLCPVPRDATSAWFSLAGDAAADTLATVCPLDLRAKAFPDCKVAQTLLGQVSVIVTRDRMLTLDRFHILVDWSTAHHLWSVLCDAAANVVERGG